MNSCWPTCVNRRPPQCLARLRFPRIVRGGHDDVDVAPSSVASLDVDPSGQPVSWLRLMRVALIQHRAALITIFAAFVVLVIAIVIGRDAVSSSYANYLAAGCTLAHPIDLGVCANTANQFADIPSFTPLVIALRLFPLVIGAFVGAPLVAREMESGTYRFAWTQGVGRTRLLYRDARDAGLDRDARRRRARIPARGLVRTPLRRDQHCSREPLAVRAVHDDVVDDPGLDTLRAGARDVGRRSREAHGCRDSCHRGHRRGSPPCSRPVDSRIFDIGAVASSRILINGMHSGPINLSASPGQGPAGSWLVRGGTPAQAVMCWVLERQIESVLTSTVLESSKAGASAAPRWLCAAPLHLLGLVSAGWSFLDSSGSRWTCHTRPRASVRNRRSALDSGSSHTRACRNAENFALTLFRARTTLTPVKLRA